MVRNARDCIGGEQLCVCVLCCWLMRVCVRANPTTSIIVKIWTTCPHVSNVAPYAETSTTDNVP